MILSLMGSATSLILSLTVFERTGNPSSIAFVMAAGLAGSIYMAPLVGSFIDSLSRRVAMRVANSVSGVCSVLLLVALKSQWPVFPVLLVLVFVSSMSTLAVTLTLQSTVRLFRKEADLTRVNGLLSIVDSAPSIAGPLIGALVYASGRSLAVFLMEGVASLVVALVVLPLVAIPDDHTRSARNVFRGARAGFGFIRSDAPLLSLQSSFVLLNFANGLAAASVTTLVILGAVSSPDGAPGGNARLAFFNAAGSIGLLLGGVVVAAVAHRFSRDALISGGMLLGAVCGRLALVAVCSLGSGVVLGPALVACGLLRNFFVQVTNAPLTALWQERVPLDSQASVFGARKFLGQGLYPLALVLGGLIAQILGDRLESVGWAAATVVALGGLIELLAGLLVVVTRPASRVRAGG